MVTASSNGQAHKTGTIVQVIGSTFDAEFEEGHLPDIYNAVKIDTDNEGVPLRLVGEVQQHLAATASAASRWARPTASSAAWRPSIPAGR